MITITNAEYFSLCKTKLCDSIYIDYIRKSIIPTERLLNNSTPIPIDHSWSLRCYAYALGITYVEEFKTESYRSLIDNYYPGFTINNVFSHRKTDYLNILENIKKDLNNLKINYREIPIDETAYLSEGEYIIKVFISKNYRRDFHFIRYSLKDNIWFHKMADEQPCIIDKNNNFEFEKTKYGYEPKCIYRYDGYFRLVYEPAMKLVLKESNKILKNKC